MNPSSLRAHSRAAQAGFVIAGALAVAALIAIAILNGAASRSDRIAEAAPPESLPPVLSQPSRKVPADAALMHPIRLAGGRVFLHGNLYTPISRETASESDIRVFSPAYGRPRTGPWELDFSKLRIDHTPTNVVFTLSFAELNILEGWRNDVFRVYVDTKQNPPGPLVWPASPYPAAEREVDFSVDPRLADGEVYRHRGDVGGPVRNCKFEASLHEESESVTVKAPRRCFDYPDQLRARAQFQSPRYNGWEAWDSTEWTAFAPLGGSAMIRDPARELRQAP